MGKLKAWLLKKLLVYLMGKEVTLTWDKQKYPGKEYRGMWLHCQQKDLLLYWIVLGEKQVDSRDVIELYGKFE